MVGDLEAEQSVVGGILCDAPHVMPLAAQQLIPADFSHPATRNVYEVCLRRFFEQKPVDAISLMGEMGEPYKVFLTMLVQVVVSTHDAVAHIPLVCENARRRQSIERLAGLEEALRGCAPLEDCQARAAALAQGMAPVQSTAVNAAEGFELVRRAAGAPRSYIATGFPSLDRYLRIAPGDFVIVAGRPSSGKTALTLQMAMRMARRHETAYFSCETGVQKLYERAVCCASGVGLEEIKLGRADAGRLLECREEFAALRLTAVEAAGWTPVQVRASALQLRAKVAFIDYMTLLRGEGKSLYERASSISIALHTLARQTGIAVVGLSQLSRAAQGREPDMADLRESGQFEQDADAILFIHKEREEGQCAGRRLILAKNKEGRTGEIRVRFDGERQRFTELAAGRC